MLGLNLGYGLNANLPRQMLNLAAQPNMNLPKKEGMGQTLDMQPRLSSTSFMHPRGFSISDEKDLPWFNNVMGN